MRHFVRVFVRTSFGTSNREVFIPISMLRNRVDFSGVVPAVEIAFALPVDWQATTAPMAELYSGPPPPSAPSAPSAPAFDGNSVSALIQNLNQSNEWTETVVLKDWFINGSIEELTPESLGSIFQCIHGVHSYRSFPEIIGEAMFGRLTCKFISGVAMVVPGDHKAAVCYTFSRYCIDKQNARIEFQCLGMPPYALSNMLTSYD